MASRPEPAPAPRTHVCLDCRTVLSAGEACDCAGWYERIVPPQGPREVSLANPAGRLALVERVWGRLGASRRSRFRIDWPSRPKSLDRVPRWLRRVARAIGRFGKAPEPRGAALWVPRPAARVRGAVLDGNHGAALVAPASGEPCVAFGLELRWRADGHPVVLRDAITSGFDVELLDGRRVRILPGRIRLDGEPKTYRRAEAKGLEAFLEAVDPGRAAGEPFDPIPFQIALERVVRAGTVVEIAAELERDGDGVYRDAPEALWTPRGLPWVGIVRA